MAKAFGDEARREASRGNWLTLSNGDAAEVQIQRIGQPYEKQWPDGSSNKAIKIDVHVHTYTPLGKQPERIEDARAWDPKCAWISDIIDLSDKLEASEGEGAILAHKLRVQRIDRASGAAHGGKFGWIEVADLGRVGGAPIANPQPHVATNAQGGPTAAPIPSVAVGHDAAALIAAISAAPDLAALKAATLTAWGVLNPVGRGAEVQAANSARKQALLQARIAQAPDLAALDFVWAQVQAETAKDAAMQAALYSAITMRRAAFASSDDLPF